MAQQDLLGAQSPNSLDPTKPKRPALKFVLPTDIKADPIPAKQPGATVTDDLLANEQQQAPQRPVLKFELPQQEPVVEPARPSLVEQVRDAQAAKGVEVARLPLRERVRREMTAAGVEVPAVRTSAPRLQQRKPMAPGQSDWLQKAQAQYQDFTRRTLALPDEEQQVQQFQQQLAAEKAAKQKAAADKIAQQKQATAGHSGVRRAATQFARGVVDVVPAVQETLAEIQPTAMGREMVGRILNTEGQRDAIDSALPVDPTDEGWLTKKIPNTLGSMVPFMLTGPLGGGGAAALGMMQAMGPAAKEARAAGADEGQIGRAMLGEGVLGLTEALGAPSGLGQAARRGGVGLLTEMGEEAAQETIQQLGGNLNKAQFSGYAPDTPLLEGVGEAALLGAIGGGTMAGAHQATRMLLDRLPGRGNQPVQPGEVEQAAQLLQQAGVDPQQLIQAPERLQTDALNALQAQMRFASQRQQVQAQLQKDQALAQQGEARRMIGHVPTVFEQQAMGRVAEAEAINAQLDQREQLNNDQLAQISSQLKFESQRKAAEEAAKSPAKDNSLPSSERDRAADGQPLDVVTSQATKQDVARPPLRFNLLQGLQQEQQRAKKQALQFVPDEMMPASAPADAKPADLVKAVRAEGGLGADDDVAGELRRLGVKESGTTGIFNPNTGLPVDEVRLRMKSEGLTQAETVDDFVTELDDAISRRKNRQTKPEDDEWSDTAWARHAEQWVEDREQLDAVEQILQADAETARLAERAYRNEETTEERQALWKRLSDAGGDSLANSFFVDLGRTGGRAGYGRGQLDARVEARPDGQQAQPGAAARTSQPAPTDLEKQPSQYQRLVNENKAAINQLYGGLDLTSPEAQQLVGQLREYAKANQIAGIHVARMLDDVRNHQMRQASEADRGAPRRRADVRKVTAPEQLPETSELEAPEDWFDASDPDAWSELHRVTTEAERDAMFSRMQPEELDDALRALEERRNSYIKGLIQLDPIERAQLFDDLSSANEERKARVKRGEMTARDKAPTKEERAATKARRIAQNKEAAQRRKEREARSPLGREVSTLSDAQLAKLVADAQRIENSLADDASYQGSPRQKQRLEAAQRWRGEMERRQANPQAKAIDQAAHEAATSPQNDRPEPTDAQKEAGNYKKGHISVHGLDVTIENPRGSKRSGKGPDGKPWEVEMSAHYGYIRSFKPNTLGEVVERGVTNIKLLSDSAKAQSTFPKSGNPVRVISVLAARVGALNSALSQHFAQRSLGDTNAARDLRATQALTQEIQRFFNVPREGGDARRVNALIRKAAADGVSTDAQLFGDSLTAQAVRTQGFNSLDVERQAVVKRRMLSLVKNFQVAKAIIKLVPVDVVNVLARNGVSAKSLGRNPAMLLDRLTTAFNDPVFVGRLFDGIASSHPIALAATVAKRIGGLDSPSGASQRSTARSTLDSGHSEDSSNGYYSTKGADGEHIDVYIGDRPASDRVFVVDQVDAETKAFDEHKVILGVQTPEQANYLYDAHFDDGKGPQRRGAVTEMSVDEFKNWLKNEDNTKPLAYQQPAQKSAAAETPPRAVTEAPAKGAEAIAVADYQFEQRHAHQKPLAYAVEVFGRPLSLPQLARLVGAPDGATLSIEAGTNGHGETGFTVKAEGAGLANFSRFIYRDTDGKWVVYNNQIHKAQGTPSGFLRPLLEAQKQQARELGFDRLEAVASGGPGAMQVGYYVLPKLGYDAPLLANHLKDAPPALAGARTLQELLALPGGAAWWKQHGRTLPVSLALHPAVAESAKIESKEAKAFRKLADAVYVALSEGKKLDSGKLRQLADPIYGGTPMSGAYSMKDAYDAAELAANYWVSERAKTLMKAKPVAVFEQLRKLMAQLPTQRSDSRTKEQQDLQQFSTPPTLAYLAAKVLNLTVGDVVVEPSAGTGSLAVFARGAGANVHANEISERRREALKRLGFTVTGADAEFLNSTLPVSIKPTAVLMNPPFSSTGDRGLTNSSKYGARHVEEALLRLEDGGRLVAIVSDGMGMDKPKLQEWWQKIAGKYNIRADVSLSGKEYAKYGTTYDNRLLVIDKTGPTPGATYADRASNVFSGHFDRIEDAYDALQAIAQDKPAVAQREASVSASGGAIDVTQQAQPTATEARPATVGQAARPSARSERGRAETAGSGSGGAGVGRSGSDTATRGATQPGESAGSVPAGEPRPANTARKEAVPSGGRTVADVEPGRVDLGLNNEALDERKEEAGGTFVQYQPAKIRGGGKHPAPIVEAASMAAIQPPDTTYQPNLPQETIEKRLSGVQLETVVYAGQRHEQRTPSGARAGYFIGDGTGVGKGRQISAIIFDNWRQGRRRAVWFSTGTQLKESAQRDLDGVGAKDIPLHLIHDQANGKPMEAGDGVMFATYSMLIGKPTDKEKMTRYDQIRHWLGKDGVIVFDEGHKAKNAIGAQGEGTQTGQAVIELQKALPDARVVYASATGATDVRNMAYMERLGMWGPGTAFPQGFESFWREIEGGGVGAMEMVARDMKAVGAYASRSISYGVDPESGLGVEYVKSEHVLSEGQREVYDGAAAAWTEVSKKIELAIAATNGGNRQKSRAMSVFYSAQQRFFKALITAAKVPTAIERTEQALKEGKQVVISLIGTGESQQNRIVAAATASGADLEEMDFSPREVLYNYIDRSFPVEQFKEVRDPQTKAIKRVPVTDEQGNPVLNAEAVRMREDLKRMIEGLRLPESPLDQIINHFEAQKVGVAELTGRKKRITRDPKTGKMSLQKRAPVPAKQINEYEMAQFQSGKKPVAVISQAAAEGISLHADKDAPTRDKRRVQITLELDWSADKQMQTFGRTHRTNQSMPPEFVLLSSNVGGEARFISTIARRLASLGALTKGQRDAAGAGADFADFNFETTQGEAATATTLRALQRAAVPDVPNGHDVLEQMGMLDKDGNIKEENLTDVTRFLNRILAQPLAVQNRVFDYFAQTYQRIVERQKEEGVFDAGVTDLRAQGIERKGDAVEVYADPRSGARTMAHTLELEYPAHVTRFQQAMEHSFTPSATEGATFARNKKTGKVALLLPSKNQTEAASGTVKKTFSVSYPEKMRGSYVDADTIPNNWETLHPTAARSDWEAQADAAPETTKEEVVIMAGALLPVWQHLKGDATTGERLQIVRVQLPGGERLVGVKMTPSKARRVMRSLGLQTQRRSAEDIFDAVQQKGENVSLMGGLMLGKIRVRGENAIQLLGVTRSQERTFREMGLIEEKNFSLSRFYVPISREKGVEVLNKLLASFPEMVEANAADAPAASRGNRPRLADATPEQVIEHSVLIVKPPTGTRPARIYANDLAMAVLRQALNVVYGQDYGNARAFNATAAQLREVAAALREMGAEVGGATETKLTALANVLNDATRQYSKQGAFSIVDASSVTSARAQGLAGLTEGQDFRSDVREEQFHWAQREISGSSVALTGKSWAEKRLPARYRRELLRRGYQDDAELLAAEAAAQIAAGNFEGLGLRTDAAIDAAFEWLGRYFERVAKAHGLDALDQFKHLPTRAKEAREKGRDERQRKQAEKEAQARERGAADAGVAAGSRPGASSGGQRAGRTDQAGGAGGRSGVVQANEDSQPSSRAATVRGADEAEAGQDINVGAMPRQQPGLLPAAERAEATDFSAGPQAKQQPSLLPKEPRPPATDFTAGPQPIAQQSFEGMEPELEPMGALEIISTARKAGLLTGITTHLRNVLGNAAFQVAEETARIPASIADLLASTATRQRTVTGPSAKALARSSYAAATDGVKKAVHIMKTGVPDVQAMQLQTREMRTRSRLFNAYVNGVFRLLAAEDQIFRTYALTRALEDRARAIALTELRAGKIERKRGAVRARAQELIKHPEADLMAAAIFDSEVATFNNDNQLSEAIKHGRSHLPRSANFALDMVMPFDRTPTNILARVLEYSPLGFAKAGRDLYRLARSVNRGVFSPDDQRKFARTFGRATIGSGLVAMGWALAAAGRMIGYEDDDDAQDFAKLKKLREQGRSPLSIYVPATNTWHQIGGFSPLGNLLAIGATLYREGLSLEGATRTAGRVVTEQPLLESVKTVTKMSASPGSSLGNLAGSFVPKAVKDVGTLIDPTPRKAKGFKESVQRAVPIWKDRLPAQPYEGRRSDVLDPTLTRVNRGPIAPQKRKTTLAEMKFKFEPKIEAELKRVGVEVAPPKPTDGESEADYQKLLKARETKIAAAVERFDKDTQTDKVPASIAKLVLKYELQTNQIERYDKLSDAGQRTDRAKRIAVEQGIAEMEQSPMFKQMAPFQQEMARDKYRATFNKYGFGAKTASVSSEGRVTPEKLATVPTAAQLKEVQEGVLDLWKQGKLKRVE